MPLPNRRKVAETPGYSNASQRKLLLYCQNSLNYAIKLTDSKIGDYRFRIGDYRIILISKRKIIIVAVGHRKDIYK